MYETDKHFLKGILRKLTVVHDATYVSEQWPAMAREEFLERTDIPSGILLHQHFVRDVPVQTELPFSVSSVSGFL